MTLTRCGTDPRTTGHVELITLADQLVIAVLNEQGAGFDAGRRSSVSLAEEYRQLRIRAVTEAGGGD